MTIDDDQLGAMVKPSSAVHAENVYHPNSHCAVWRLTLLIPEMPISRLFSQRLVNS